MLGWGGGAQDDGSLEMQALGGAQIVRESDCRLEFGVEYLLHEGTYKLVHIQGHEDDLKLEQWTFIQHLS